MWLLNVEPIAYFEKASSIKTPAGLENLIFKEHNIKEGDFVFIEWPKLQEEILITNERTALIRSDISKFCCFIIKKTMKTIITCNSFAGSNKIKQVLNTYILQTHRVKQILTKDQRDALKTEAPQAEYDVIVSVLNPRPDIMNAKWHVQMAVESINICFSSLLIKSKKLNFLSSSIFETLFGSSFPHFQLYFENAMEISITF